MQRAFLILLQDGLDALHRLAGSLSLAEGGEADVALAAGTKAGAGSGDHVGLPQQLVEEVPGAHAVGGAGPDIGGVLPAGHGEAGGGQALPDDPGVVQVVVDGLLHLSPALGAVHGLSAPLDHIGHSVELGALAAVPQAVEGGAIALQLLGDDGIGAAGAGEAGGLGEGAELDGAGAGPLDLKDGMRNGGIGDEGLVGAVVQDDGAGGVGVVHPGLQLGLGGHRAGGIVGEAQVDQVHLLLRDGGGEAVVRHAGHIDQVGPPACCRVVVPGPARHGVGVHIDGVHRVAHRHHVVHTEDVPDVAAVALGAVGDEDLIGGDVHTPGPVVVLGNGLPQEVVALLRAVAVEPLGGGHLVHRPVHGGGDGGGQRPGHVADAQPDQLPVRVGLAVGGHPPGDLGKQIAAGQLVVIGIDVCHGALSFVLNWIFSFKDRVGRSCHCHFRSGGPLQRQHAAGQLHSGSSSAPALHHRRRQGGAGAGAAGQGLSAAPLPHPHHQPVRSRAADKLGVDPPGKGGVALKAGPQPLQVQLLRPVRKDHGVGIPHGHRGDLPQPACRRQLHDGPHLRAAHIHPDGLHQAVLRQQLQGAQAAAGLDGQLLFTGQAPVVDILAQAADAVAAHLPLRAVGVEHPHAEIGPVRGADADDPVAPHAEVAVAHPPGQGGQVLRQALQSVEVDVVVAQTLHFGKAHMAPPVRAYGAAAVPSRTAAARLSVSRYSMRLTAGPESAGPPGPA